MGHHLGRAPLCYWFQWEQKYKHKIHFLGENTYRDCGSDFVFEFMRVVCLPGQEQGQDQYEQRTISCYSEPKWCLRETFQFIWWLLLSRLSELDFIKKNTRSGFFALPLLTAQNWPLALSMFSSFLWRVLLSLSSTNMLIMLRELV